MLDQLAPGENILPARLWLPGSPDEARAGYLILEVGQHPRARVVEGWGDGVVDQFLDHEQVHVPTIWGKTIGTRSTKSTDFTLLNVWDGLASRSFPSPYVERHLRAGLLVAGAHVPNLDEVEQVYAKHSSLPHVWQSDSAKQILRFEDPDGQSFAGADFSFEATDPVQFSIPSKAMFEISVELSALGQPTVPKGPDARFGGAILYSVQATRGVAVRYGTFYDDTLRPFGELLEFASGRSGRWTSVRVKVDDSGTLADLYHRELQPGHELPESNHRWPNLVLSGPSVDLGQVVARWFSLYPDHLRAVRSGLDGLHGTISNEAARQVAMAIEGLSDIAKAHSATAMSKDQWKVLKPELKKLFNGCNIEWSDSFATELKRAATSPSLRSRAEAVLKFLEAAGHTISDDIGEVPGKIVKVRVAESHRSAGDFYPDSQDVVDATRYGRRILAALLLAYLVDGADQDPSRASDILAHGW